MGFYNRAVGKKISSAAMGATAMDSISDTVSTALVLLATFISQKTGLISDGWFGCAGGRVYLCQRCALHEGDGGSLLGQAPGKELVDQIRKIVTSSPNVYGMHDLIGPRLWSRQTDDLPPCGDSSGWGPDGDPLMRSTILGGKTAGWLHCSATIHMDPIVTNDAETNEMRSRVAHLAKRDRSEAFDSRFSHGKGDTHTNLIFDVAVPYEVSSYRCGSEQ